MEVLLKLVVVVGPVVIGVVVVSGEEVEIDEVNVNVWSGLTR